MTSPTGLSDEAAQRHLANWGYNELPRNRTRSFLANAAHALAEPMFALLLTAVCVVIAPIYLSDGYLLTTNCLEPNLWMACAYQEKP